MYTNFSLGEHWYASWCCAPPLDIATQLLDLVEDFRDQGFVTWSSKPYSSEFCGFLKKASPSREEPEISSSTMNSKARFDLLYTYSHVRSQTSVHQPWTARHALICFIRTCTLRLLFAWSVVARSIHVAMILYIGILNMWCHVRVKLLRKSLWGVRVV